MNYIGSKLSLLDFIMDCIRETLAENGDARPPAQLRAADLFAGTGVVGAALKGAGYHVDANDLQYYSYALCRHLVGNNGPDGARAAALIERLNAAAPREGFIFRNYAPGSGSGRMYFSDANAMRCDGMRAALEEMRAEGGVNEDEYYFLLASLINSVDQYANTASVYGAYLKRLKRSAQRPLALAPLPAVPGAADCRVFHEDALELAGRLSGDILYLDPPYNARQYSANYHLLETIARFDAPELTGKTGLRADQQKSDFCSVRRVCEAFEELVRRADYRYLFLSYNNEGLMPLERIRSIMEQFGAYRVRTRAYRRFKADRDENRRHKGTETTEYLHILIKG